MESPLCSTPKLIETLLWSPVTGFKDVDMHLARMGRTAKILGYPMDIAAIQAALTVYGDMPQRVRITVESDGRIKVVSVPFTPNPKRWVIKLSNKRLSSNDPWLQMKTSNRGLYDNERSALPAGIDEWLFLNELEQVCEGTITNIFVVLANGGQVTPPVSCGLLPGILRQRLLLKGWKERVLTVDDLIEAREIMMGNALRGLIKADLAPIA